MNALLLKSMSVWDGSRSIETNHLLRLNAEETKFSWRTSSNIVLGIRSPDEIKLPELEEMASKTDQSLTFMDKLSTNPVVVKLIFSTWSLWDCTIFLQVSPLGGICPTHPFYREEACNFSRCTDFCCLVMEAGWARRLLTCPGPCLLYHLEYILVIFVVEIWWDGINSSSIGFL